MTHRARTVDEMLDLGSHAAEQAVSGCVWLLSGELGAGKTHWTKGFVRGIGSNDVVTSPTFGLVHEYHGGRLPVFHFDFYRLGSADELHAIGWDDYLERDGVVVVEWGNRFPEMFPAAATRLHFSVEPDGSRLVESPR